MRGSNPSLAFPLTTAQSHKSLCPWCSLWLSSYKKSETDSQGGFNADRANLACGIVEVHGRGDGFRVGRRSFNAIASRGIAAAAADTNRREDGSDPPRTALWKS